MLLRTLCLLILLLAFMQAHAAMPSRTIDGDTFRLSGQTIRLYGIDAPEKDQTCDTAGKEWHCGEVAADKLHMLIAARDVVCKKIDVDRYKRTVARCYIEEGGQKVDIARAMVLSGWALAYERYSKDYLPDQAIAEAMGSGIWGSAFTTPQEWRGR